MALNKRVYEFSESVSKPARLKTTQLLTDWKIGSKNTPLLISPLEGGLNNINLVIKDEHQVYVLKLRPSDCEVFGASPETSYQTQKWASDIGIAPKVLAVDKTEWHTLSEFLTGNALQPSSFSNKSIRKDIIKTLRNLHGIQFTSRQFKIFDDIELFVRGIRQAGSTYSSELNEMLALVDKLKTTFSSPSIPQGFCHNDLVPQNFIWSPTEGMRLVDFDYAGTGLIAVDLASAASQFEMNQNDEECFLKMYDEKLDDNQRARVSVLKFINNIREITFTLLAEPRLSGIVATNEQLNYTIHRAFNLKQAEQCLNNPIFRDKLTAVSSVRPGALF